MKRWLVVFAALGALAMPIAGCSDDTDTPADDGGVRDDGAPPDVPDVTEEAGTTCGDGTVDTGAGEECDDGNTIDTDACIACRNAICGDGHVQAGVEECDDGNTVAADGCENDCTETPNPCGAYAESCPNDPTDGPAGAPCADVVDCEATFDCWAESISYYNSQAYISWAGGYCLPWGWGTAGCDPDNPASCPTGSACVYLGDNPTTGAQAYGCFDSCSVASSTGDPWDANCDCRDFYECALTGEFCIPGCSNDAECCEIWEDRNSDQTRQPAEVTVVEGCVRTCDMCKYSCTEEGSATAEVGDPCEHESECPPMGRCLAERYYEDFIDGMCIQDRCDLVGRECPAGAGCSNLGSSADPFYTCVKPCTVGGEPGDTGFPCRDAGATGPSAGDHACNPASEGFWFDATTDDGFCFPGNFPGGSVAFGGACTTDDQCVSPLGLGNCYSLIERPGFCGAACNEGMAADGFCEIDPAATDATGVCFSGLCLEACDTPNGNLTENGCSSPTMACYPTTLFGTYVYVTTGKTAPAGLCFPACPNTAFCADMWTGGGTCNTTTGVCALTK
jgi:cysteine-rich repeat protein